MTNRYVEWKGWSSAEFGSFGPEEALYYAAELDASGIGSISGLRVAELGYGNGAFAGWAREARGHWMGREINPQLQQRAAEAGYEVINPETDFSTACGREKLDLIVAFDVIEHMDIGAIRSFLREVKEALRPGGWLLFRVPSGDSPFSGAIYHGDPTHRTLLGSSAARLLAIEAGLGVCQIRSPALPIGGIFQVRAARRMAVRLARLVVFSFVRFVLMGHADAVVSPNMIVVLRKEGGAAGDAVVGVAGREST